MSISLGFFGLKDLHPLPLASSRLGFEIFILRVVKSGEGDYTYICLISAFLWLYKIESFSGKKISHCPIMPAEEEETAPNLKIGEGKVFDELRSSFILEHNYEHIRKSGTQKP
ncbi:hypothetical protein GQ457_14G012380 [Hibiscus cannabinus]